MREVNGVGEQIYALDQKQASQCAHNGIVCLHFNATDRATVSSILFFFVIVMLHYYYLYETLPRSTYLNRHHVCGDAFVTASICGMSRIIVVTKQKTVQDE